MGKKFWFYNIDNFICGNETYIFFQDPNPDYANDLDNPGCYGPFNTFNEAKNDALARFRQYLADVRAMKARHD